MCVCMSICEGVCVHGNVHKGERGEGWGSGGTFDVKIVVKY